LIIANSGLFVYTRNRTHTHTHTHGKSLFTTQRATSLEDARRPDINHSIPSRSWGFHIAYILLLTRRLQCSPSSCACLFVIIRVGVSRMGEGSRVRCAACSSVSVRAYLLYTHVRTHLPRSVAFKTGSSCGYLI